MRQPSNGLDPSSAECRPEIDSGGPEDTYETQGDSIEQPEEQLDGGLSSALRNRGGRPAAALLHFSALNYPLLKIADDDLQTPVEAALNLMNNLLGAGILVMPRAFADAGLFTGLLLMLLVATANRFTLHLILQMSKSSAEDQSYPEIGRHVFGQLGFIVVLLCYLLYTGGILVAYLIALADILEQLVFGSSVGRFGLICLGILLVAPGALLKSLKAVALLSGVCMAGVCTLVVTLSGVCIYQVLWPEEYVSELPHDEISSHVHGTPSGASQVLRSISLFALQFSVQAGGIEVLNNVAREEAHQCQNADENGSDSDGYEASGISKAQAISKRAFVIAAAFSGIIGMAGYLRFGSEVEGDILLNFSKGTSRRTLLISNVAYGFVLTASFAFIIVPCRHAAVDILSLRRRSTAVVGEGWAAVPFHKVTFGILGICGVVAWLVPNLADMLQFVGVRATMALAFILPCAFRLELKRRQEGISILSPSNALPLMLITFGCGVIACSTFDFLF